MCSKLKDKVYDICFLFVGFFILDLVIKRVRVVEKDWRESEIFNNGNSLVS